MGDGALAHCAKCTEKSMSYARLGISPDQSGSQSNSELKDSNGKPAETLENSIQSSAEMNYYLGGKNLSVCLHAYLRLESTNQQKIGEIIKALQICKRLTQTASF